MQQRSAVSAVHNRRSFFAYLPSPLFFTDDYTGKKRSKEAAQQLDTHIRVHMYSYSYIDATADEPHIINIIRKRADVFFFLRSDEVLTELSAVDGQVERG